jgi:hypothetical protein
LRPTELTPPTDFDRFFDVFLLWVILGFLLVIVGLGYAFDPKGILRMNAFMRDNFFKDSYVLLKGRRIGILLVVLGFILLAVGYPTRIP